MYELGSLSYIHICYGEKLNATHKEIMHLPNITVFDRDEFPKCIVFFLLDRINMGRNTTCYHLVAKVIVQVP